ncbi:MAG: sigma-54-dependent Fis family transcriptional regulator [Gammaproteobacteria bacterium]|nr:sigma-54-dependent Fis family transcriptional regulator [Gammaproteobacteria bacterium]
MGSSAVLVVEDDNTLREALSDTLEMAGYRVVTAENGQDALVKLEQEPVAMVVSDVQMDMMDGHALLKNLKLKRPDLPVLLMTAYGSIQKAVEAMHDGAADYLVKPFEAEVLVTQVAKYIGEPGDVDRDLVGDDPRTEALRDLAKRVADSEATVLITGESGSGKEVLARYIHRQSPRADKPFIAVNCAAIPENMLEATLFGYEKGAFTGAHQANPGKFEQAQGGTLLLDEISEMDLGLQAKLLRVLQEKEVERLGGRKLIQLDVRVLATSNRNMQQEVAEGKFREDLYYRLNVFPMQIAPLRERAKDIVPLAAYLFELHARRAGRLIPVLDESAKTKLESYRWPGNVRELDNVIQRALILQRGETISDSDILFEQVAETINSSPVSPPPQITMPEAVNQVADSGTLGDVKLGATTGTLGSNLKNQEFAIIIDALQQGNRKQAATKLGISERTLRYKLAQMREAGIEIP